MSKESTLDDFKQEAKRGRRGSYTEFKESGIDWLGKVPHHWEIHRAEKWFSSKANKIDPDEISDEEVKHYSLPNIHECGDGKIEDPESISSNKKFLTGDEILISKLNPENGIVALPEFDEHSAIASTEFVEMSTKDDILRRFGYYFYSSECVRQYLSSEAQSVTLSHKRVKPRLIHRIPFLEPPKEEQESIVEFLDKETGDIDQLVKKKRQLINLLEEKRTALIKSAVGNGIETEVGRRESGVEWLGKIPKHWEVRKLRYLADIDTGGKDTKDAVDDGDYPFFVRSPTKEYIDTYSFDGEAVLTAGDGVGVGEVFHYIDGKFDYHQRVYKISDFPEALDGKYFYYYIKANLKMEIFKNNAKSTVDSLRMPMFKSFPVAFGDLEEQRDIVKYLDNQNNQIDNLIEKVEEGIKRLKEYRTALITEAVTGQIDVRGEV